MIKWKMNKDYTALEVLRIVSNSCNLPLTPIISQKMRFFNDETAQMVFSISFLPDCGNKYFVAAVDEGLRLYDFETRQVRLAFSVHQ